jgi:hypothetical protein
MFVTSSEPRDERRSIPRSSDHSSVAVGTPRPLLMGQPSVFAPAFNNRYISIPYAGLMVLKQSSFALIDGW